MQLAEDKAKVGPGGSLAAEGASQQTLQAASSVCGASKCLSYMELAVLFEHSVVSAPPPAAGGGASLVAAALLRHRTSAGGEHAPADGGTAPAGRCAQRR
jgi:hypothetical protein